eukprot:25781-Eustigmatos_ZCMA.PRE.1
MSVLLLRPRVIGVQPRRRGLERVLPVPAQHGLRPGEATQQPLCRARKVCTFRPLSRMRISCGDAQDDGAYKSA